jgi:preprotein translocase subunit SecY
MMEQLKSVFEIPDLRKRILFTVLMLALYRLGSFIPTPGINASVFEQAFENLAAGLLGLLSMFSGGSLRRLTVLALGIMPYITASIILQLLTAVFPHLEKLKKEGDLGRRKITQYTRYLTVGISAFQAFTVAGVLQRATSTGTPLVTNPGPAFIVQTVLTLTTGALFVMWLGEQITARGIGNGMSLLIFAGIVVGLPRAIGDLYDKVGGGLHRARGARRAAHPHPVCAPHRGPQDCGRCFDAPAAESQQQRRDAYHLRGLDPDLPADHCAGRECEKQPRGRLASDELRLGGAPVHDRLRSADPVFRALLSFDCL